MGQSPIWKVYREKEYIASCKYAEDAAALCVIQNKGTVRYGHNKIVWVEGHEDFSAGDSYQGAAEIMFKRAFPGLGG